MTSQRAGADALGSQGRDVLALGEVLANHCRYLSVVHQALINGATWEQIAEVIGLPEHTVRDYYRRWADDQHKLWQQYGDIGLDDAAHADAMRRAADLKQSELEAER